MYQGSDKIKGWSVQLLLPPSLPNEELVNTKQDSYEMKIRNTSRNNKQSGS